MKKNVFKSAFAIACVVAASMGGFKAYDQHNKNVAAANLLFTENVEALSGPDADLFKAVVKNGSSVCGWLGAAWTCYEVYNAIDEHFGSHYGWETETVKSDKYVNGQHQVAVTVIKTCVSKKGWGGNECQPGQVIVIYA